MWKYGLISKPQLGLTNYVVFGEILNTIQKAANSSPTPQFNILQNVGKTRYLYSALPILAIYGMVKSHMIDNVISEIEDVKKYNTVKDVN
jgi:hypothetical protein